MRGKLLTETDKNLWIVYLHVARQRLKGSPVQGELAAKLTEGLLHTILMNLPFMKEYNIFPADSKADPSLSTI